MSEQFATKDEVRTIMEAIMKRLEPIEKTVFNHGNGLVVNYTKAKESLERIETQLNKLSVKMDGLQTRVQGEDAVEAAQERATKEWREKFGMLLKIVGAILAILTFLIGIGSLYLTFLTQKGDLKIPNVFRSESVQMEYANRQVAGPQAPY